MIALRGIVLDDDVVKSGFLLLGETCGGGVRLAMELRGVIRAVNL